MNHITNYTIPTKLVGQEFKNCPYQFSDRVIIENEKVSNDSFFQSNEYVGEDGIGRKFDLTSIINRPNGYLQGSLSDKNDVDCFSFSVAEYKGLSIVSDKYNLDITITLDHVPKGCEYDLILYDEAGNQVGIGTDNGNGGKSITLPSLYMENRGYIVKVQAKDSSPVSDENYHISFQTKQAEKNAELEKYRNEMQEYAGILREKLNKGEDTSEIKQAIQEIRDKMNAIYEKELAELHKQQAEEYITDGVMPTESEIDGLLQKMQWGEALTEQEKGLVTIFASSQELDTAKAGAELNTTLKQEIFKDMEKVGIDISEDSFSIKIGFDGKVTVNGMEDDKMAEKAEAVLHKYAEKLTDMYMVMNEEIQDLSKREQTYLKTAVKIERFLSKATNGSVSLADIHVINGRIEGLPANLDKIINHPGQNQTYMDYRADILSIKQYEKEQQCNILSGVEVEFWVMNNRIAYRN